MKKFTVPFIAGLALLAGCVMPAHTDVYAPLSSEVGASGRYSIDNSVKCVKHGSSSAKGIVFFVTGDSSIKAAMDNGGITKVHHIDTEITSIFGFYAIYKTVVWGE